MIRAGQSLNRSLSACAAVVAFSLAVPAPAALLNGGFEDGGGSLANWTTFNNVIPNVLAAPITPRSGTHVAKLFGGFNGAPNYSGILQNLPASPGEVWEARAYARHNTGDELTGTRNRLVMKIEFYRVPGGTYGSSDMLQEYGLAILDSGTPRDVWVQNSFQVVAPPDTVEARIVFAFVQNNYHSGAGLIDDVVFSTVSPAPPPPPPDVGWRLIWGDEFEDSSLDCSKWRVEDAHLIKNNELQYYTPEDVYVQSGVLTLRSQERSFWGWDGWGNWREFDYTSGLVESRGRFYHTYGRIEVRAKLPYSQGMWPAHWMLPVSGAWPPEVDIMELLGHEPNKVYMTHHWGTWPNVFSHGGSFVGPDFSQNFHTFAIEWMPDRIDWFVDDVLRFSSPVYVPDEPFFIILNTAVGGDWPGNPDPTTVFPQYHEIDYVRWYVPADYAGFCDCMHGPNAVPAPTPPTTTEDCLDTFDSDGDTDVDLVDFAEFQSALRGLVGS